MVQQLISRGAALDQMVWNSRTPLHLACENNHLDVALVLLEAGAAIDITDRVGGLHCNMSSDSLWLKQECAANCIRPLSVSCCLCVVHGRLMW